MTVQQLKEFARLYAIGFRPYTGAVDAAVYDRLKCLHPERAYWISKWPILNCFGCTKRCTPQTPEGFQVALPLEETERQYGFGITAEQMMESRTLLLANEAAYCLRTSRSTIYRLIAEGRLDRHQDLPIRVTVASVRREMGRLDT